MRFARKRSLVLLLVLGMAIAGVQSAWASDAQSFDKAARQLLDVYASSIVAGDADRWIALWDHEGIELPPDNPLVEGTDFMYNDIKAEFYSDRYETYEVKVLETRYLGSFGYVRGTFNEVFVTKSGGMRYSWSGKFLTILKLQKDGSWRIYRDCFNFNSPRVLGLQE